jgi:hypothetical protein
MRGIIDYVRTDVFPHWRIWLCAFGVSGVWHESQEPPAPPPSPEVEMVGEVAKYAIGAYIAHEMLAD